jgi:hypothetical protein
VNADIFRDGEYLSSSVTDRPEAIDQLTASETRQTPAININESLHPLGTDQQVVGPSNSINNFNKQNN